MREEISTDTLFIPYSLCCNSQLITLIHGIKFKHQETCSVFQIDHILQGSAIVTGFETYY